MALHQEEALIKPARLPLSPSKMSGATARAGAKKGQAPLAQAFGNEFSSGKGSALRKRALAVTGAKLDQPAIVSALKAPPSGNPACDVVQGWNNSCGANAVLALQAAVDPTFAAQLAAMTPEERVQYEAAVMQSDPANQFALGEYTARPILAGWGRDMMARQVSDRFGGEAEVINVEDRQHGVNELLRLLEEGKPVAIGLTNHWLSATEVRGQSPDAEILVHDSWTGTTAWVSEADLRDRAGMNWVANYFPGTDSPGNLVTLVAPGEPSLDASSTFRANEG